MKALRRIVYRPLILTGALWAAAVLLVTAGCSQEPEPLRVDLSSRISLARPPNEPDHGNSMRIAVASMISPRTTFESYRKFLDYLGAHLGRSVRLVQRRTYAEVSEMLAKGKIDVAFVCSGPYATLGHRYRFRPLAAPLVHGQPYYRSYLIVGKNRPYRSLEDLRGKRFAFTDPDSLTGRLVPLYWLHEMGETPGNFFAQSIYTFSHDNSILAVAKGMVDGAAVDSLVWDHFAANNADWAQQTRIIRKSKEFGVPPVVASAHLSEQWRAKVQKILLTMHEDAAGASILASLKVDRFVPIEEHWYEPIRTMERSIHEDHEENP